MHSCILLALVLTVLCIAPARAVQQEGTLTRDLTVGTANDVHLKSGTAVHVMRFTATKAVIMTTLADGSNGIFEIDATAVAVTAPATPLPAPAPAPAPSIAPAPTPKVAPVAATQPAAAPAPSGPPTWPDDFVGGPEFITKAGRQGAGTASLVRLKDGTQCYLASARHLLGPDGGFKKQTAAKDVPDFVQSIDLHSFAGGSHTFDVTGLLTGAKDLKADGGPPIDDMALYRLHDSSLQRAALPLAEQLPAIGTPVRVIAHVRGGVPAGQVLQPGKVSRIPSWIVIQFDNDAIDTAGASGAPVLNAAGEVIGVYSGHNEMNGHKMGFIIPAPDLAKLIRAAPAPTP